MADKLTIKEVNEKVEQVTAKVDSLSGSISQLIEIMTAKKEEEKQEVKKEPQKEIPVQNENTGTPNWAEVHPVHDKTAREILGELLDRTYMSYPKGGGTLFTVVIKKDFSNAPDLYLKTMKEDHRTCNLESDRYRGEDGAKRWCLLIKQNLKVNDKKI